MTKPTSHTLRTKAPLALAILVLLAILDLTGCGRGFTIVTPAGFAELEDQEHYGYRATTAEGVVVAVRKEVNNPYGDLSFWSGAVDAQLRRRGYVATEAVDVKTNGGVEGRQIRYNHKYKGRKNIFWVTVFVTKSAVVTIEAGGDSEYFGKLEEAVSKAISSLKIS